MNEPDHIPKQEFSTPDPSFKIDFGNALLVAFLIMMSLLITGVVVNLPVKIWPGFYHISLPLSFLLGGLLGIYILISYLKIKWSTISQHLKISPSVWVTFLSILLYVFTLPFAEFLTSLFPTTGNRLIEELYKSTTQAFEIMLDYKVAGFITVCILAPIFEEILFRGILFRGMLQYGMNPVVAIVTSSILFGMAHMNPWQFLGAGVLGAIFAYVYYRTKSLWICIFLHALNNSVSYFMMIQMESMEENVTNPNDWLLMLSSLMIAILIGFGIYKSTPQIKWN